MKRILRYRLYILSIALLVIIWGGVIWVVVEQIDQRTVPAMAEVTTTPTPQITEPPIITTIAPTTEPPEEEALDIPEREALDIPDGDTSFKSYMGYHKITNTSSKQWALQQEATTDYLGFRKYGGIYYMVALGTYYAQEAGQRFRITLDSGKSFLAITGDIKDDRHTDEKNQYAGTSQHKNVVEFIVDIDQMDPYILNTLGNVSALGFEGNITSIEEVR